MGAPHDEGSAFRIRDAEPRDVPVLIALFGELASYEKLEHALVASEERLDRALFGDPPAAYGLIAERTTEALGYAIYFHTFSTFLAIRGIWLEDLYVRPAARKGGVGRALLATVAKRLRDEGGERLEWSALDWNELALGFYASLGARRMDEWITHRLVGDDLARLAGEAG